MNDGEKDQQTTFPTNSNPSMKLVDEQDNGVSHLCLYENWYKHEIITCDSDHAELFACIGAIEGQIHRCDKPTQREISVPVCLHVKILKFTFLKQNYATLYINNIVF